MKRIVSLVVLALAMTMTVQAQRLKFGVKGGLNITKMSFSESDLSPDNQTGFYIGPAVKVSLPLGFVVDGAVLYDQRSAKVESDWFVELYYIDNEKSPSTNETIKQKSLNIPINLRYHIGLGSEVGVYLAVGPQFGFAVGDKIYNTVIGEYTLKSSNLSFNFGAGLYLLKHLEVGFTYNLAAGKSGEFKYLKDIDPHNNAWQIGLAYFF